LLKQLLEKFKSSSHMKKSEPWKVRAGYSS